ncbi:hypothetical protein LTR64_001379 [Lithohypha guttulata]|uniref:uncharacterized protein n=1 Tax=Lithohypha guttulata TaxID=1690604 RepID=UPI002DE16A73|nr:hypothetical protein LTR51_003573 [Lithohypha guttulata]
MLIAPTPPFGFGTYDFTPSRTSLRCFPLEDSRSTMEDLSNYKVNPPAPVTLPGRYVTLVPYDREQHLERLWQALGGANGINELIKYFPNDTYLVSHDLGSWIERSNAASNFTTLVVVRNSDSTVVGMASYMRPDPSNGVVEVGSVAHGSAMARSPLSTELHYLMAKHVFDDLGYRRYEWKCHNDNEPSRASAERYGFTFEGVFRQHMISRGKNRDTAWFSIIDKEWPMIRKAFEMWLEPDNFDEQGRQKKKLQEIRKELAGI